MKQTEIMKDRRGGREGDLIFEWSPLMMGGMESTRRFES